MHRPALVTPPAATPVSLAEAKAHLRVDSADEDALITALVDAATGHLDGWTGILGKAMVTQTWSQSFDRFCPRLDLPLGPVQSIASVKWRATDGQISTVASSDYSLRTDAGGRNFVRFVDGWSAPSDLYQVAAVTVEYVAGYGAPADVPAPIKAAMLLMIGHYYKNREAVAEASQDELPLGVKALLGPYSVKI